MKSTQGFASFTKEKLFAASSLGGTNAWKSGKAHRFTSEEAKKAGSKKGLANRLNK